MNAEERAVAYRSALAGQGHPDEVALARACADLPGHFAGRRAEETWEGALLAGVLPREFQAVVAAEDWPALAVLADLAGEDPSSLAVRHNREHWGKWIPPEPQKA
jgi:hypothetical protein